ncbi:alpha/beta fold hydrolase [Plastoroseomonas arctica]|uniref:Alpha/beta hydrolase n=1 Tax=Plastoroseomonas arctica TaxID=1509237 RepID=A0AAF1KPE4_9PROT|nr:alpha/beta hydrolase [Plastoroseomonas arctica]MBR0655813.1 alpha/beta hydrolase [Plastoroseomonas arctica]
MKIAAYILVPLLVILIGLGIWLYDPDKPRAALEAQYAGPPSQFIEVAGLRLHIRDTGPREAPALLLLHGFGSSLHTWEDWARLLEPRFRVIRIDLPGFGLTGADPTGDYTDARTIAVLAALLDRLALPRVTVVGNSMGGRIAWRFAAAEPARVERLVLISPDGFASPGITYDTPVALPAIMRVLPYTLPMVMLRGTLDPSYAEPRRLTDAVAERYRDMMLAPGVRRAILARVEQHILPNPVPLLNSLAMPVLVMWGAQDKLIPVANAQDYLAAIPHAALATLPTLGHVPFEEDPALSLPPLVAFLGG